MNGDGYPVAYCAPGKRFEAGLTLMLKGERVARVVEHAFLEGSSEVFVVSGPPELFVDPEAFRAAGGPSRETEAA